MVRHFKGCLESGAKINVDVNRDVTTWDHRDVTPPTFETRETSGEIVSLHGQNK